MFLSVLRMANIPTKGDNNTLVKNTPAKLIRLPKANNATIIEMPTYIKIMGVIMQSNLQFLYQQI